MTLLDNDNLYLSLITYAIAIPSSLWSTWRAPWRQLTLVSARQHMWFGSVMALAIVWSFISAPASEYYYFRFMLITSTIIIFGYHLGNVCALLALIISQMILDVKLNAFAFNYIIGIALPALSTRWLLSIVIRSGIQNLFLFTLGCGFLGGIVSMLATGGVSIALAWAFDLKMSSDLIDQAYIFLILSFPEGFCNGAIVSSLVVLAPHLVKTYDEDFYLRK